MAQGTYSTVRESRVPGYSVRKPKTTGPSIAWRALMFSKLPGFVDNPFVVMPLYDNNAREAIMHTCTRTLRRALEDLQMVENSYAARAELAKPVLVCMCAALHILHRAGVVHGDITLDNIMQRSNGVWVLIDPDLAQVGFCTGRAINSPTTMPPEAQADPNLYRLGHKLTRRVRCAADLWALGCVMEELLFIDDGDGAPAAAEHRRLYIDPLKRVSPATRQLPFVVDDAKYPACPIPAAWLTAWPSAYAEHARPGLVSQVRDLTAQQPPSRQSDELVCISIQLLDSLCVDQAVPPDRPGLARVCVHAASFVCTEGEAPVDCVVSSNEYRTLLLVAINTIPRLPIGLQDPRLCACGTLDMLVSAPTSINAYVVCD